MNEYIDSESYQKYGDNQIYYKIKMFKTKTHLNEFEIKLEIQDISDIIYRQQSQSDKLYSDAVLSNYSHEQLTPLNSFLNNSSILISNLTNVKNIFQHSD